ncbi:DegT/DnrJ/EryC1/StrS aminotransferase family protein [Synechococcus sp. MU1642]|uniref:DegT/DnrJ/EryC1/StrS family aminotransferase n=1 Tax=Synechococcus sp. MU1642 TaxID=2508348 RepID=UPI001CF804FD|nr:DegT/DnrJ/EryC1/StrS family aminotransferase [Synechococcus sp. MU1642]MCB4407010.1 DegT/DnrJ/EryC1/StrS family aminotransferase [Synechococcus sp. MU1642]
MLQVTSPSLAPIEDFANILSTAWESGVLTHNGPLLRDLEHQIKNRLSLDRYIAVVNGTLALQMAIRALHLKGTIIVPAFTWIASVSSIQWEGCKVKFCDIDEETLNISLSSLEKEINEDVVAVMPVHAFGNPCPVKEIAAFAKRYSIKVIYDAAHAFGSTYNGKSVLSYGDISCTSTHATKIFNTGEGGGLIPSTDALSKRLERLRFFGYNSDKQIEDIGTNGKMTEIHAALGLANLKFLEKTFQHRRILNELYRDELQSFGRVKFQQISEGSNYSYFPLIFNSADDMLAAQSALIGDHFIPRRYFYPSLNTVPQCADDSTMPASESIASRILCIPCSNSVSVDDAWRIAKLIRSN